MAISKITLNGVTQMDVTKKTVDANKMLDGITALKNDGTNVTGNIATKTSSDLTVSDATVTVPAGNYASDASASVASGSATTPATTVTANPSISVNTSTGLITSTASATQSVTPTVSAGYVSAGTAGTVTVSGSNTQQLTVQAGKTVTPTESEQTAVAANRYTTGAVKVGAISPNYIGSGVTQNDSDDLTVNGPTVTAPAGYYEEDASASVASGTAGTPVATKGTVSNHSISVTPSVTNTTGYITGGTNTGTAVTVSASELVSGTKSITSPGTTDVTNYASVSVAEGGLTAGATKGTVLSNSIAVIPYVDSTSGFVGTGRITGTSVTVSAGELVSGNLEIIENGENIDVTNYATVSVDVPTGGGVDGRLTQDPEGYLVLEEYGNGNRSLKDPIRFFDYNGEIVASYTSVPTELPTVPGHEGLKNGVWNYTLQEISTQFSASGTCDIGANYMTTSEKTEIDIEFADDARLSPYLRFAVNGTVTVDWGDGSSTEDVTGTSLTSRKDIQHTYSRAGKYTITLANTSGSYAMYGSSTYTLLHGNSGTANANLVYSNCVKAIRIGKNCIIGNNAFSNCYSLSSITIPSGVTSIGSSAFYYCYSLSSITIPSSVTSIGSSAFYTCYSLSSTTIPSGVTSIGSSMFYTCRSLSSITIPNGVTSIGSSAFTACYPLSSVTIPSGVTSIGVSAFSSCSSFSSITIPSGVTSIEGNAFYSCYSLSSITIPSSVTSIGNNAFQNCYSLSSVTIPSSVTSIGDSAFSSCYGMKEYHFERTTPPTLGTTAFTNIQSDCIIYVPKSSGQTVLNAYKTATNWSGWASYIQEEPV